MRQATALRADGLLNVAYKSLDTVQWQHAGFLTVLRSLGNTFSSSSSISSSSSTPLEPVRNNRHNGTLAPQHADTQHCLFQLQRSTAAACPGSAAASNAVHDQADVVYSSWLLQQQQQRSPYWQLQQQQQQLAATTVPWRTQLQAGAQIWTSPVNVASPASCKTNGFPGCVSGSSSSRSIRCFTSSSSSSSQSSSSSLDPELGFVRGGFKPDMFPPECIRYGNNSSSIFLQHGYCHLNHA
jgi:hypothetical protein